MGCDNVLSPGAPQLIAHLRCNRELYDVTVYEVSEAFQESPDWVVVATCLVDDIAHRRKSPDRATSDAFESMGRRVDAVSWQSQTKGREFSARDWASHANAIRRFFESQNANFKTVVL